MRFISTALGLFLLSAAPVAAQDNAPPPAESQPASEADLSAHSDLYSAMQEGLDEDAMFDGIVAAMRTQIAAMPSFAASEKKKPGYIDKVMTALRPTITEYS